jgi:hypothetical protein
MAQNRFQGVDQHAGRTIDVPMCTSACPCLPCRIARGEVPAMIERPRRPGLPAQRRIRGRA